MPIPFARIIPSLTRRATVAASTLCPPPLARRWGSVHRVRPGGGCFVPTFDDGPDPADTPALLDALEETGATATFFMLVTRARARPDIVRDVVARGHDVALHGLDHTSLTTVAPERAAQMIRDGRSALEDLAGVEVHYFRPPYGALSPAVLRGVHAAGLECVMWGATTWDWRDITQERRVLKATSGLRDGSILLLHDATAGPLDGAFTDVPTHRLDRVDLLRRIVKTAARRGLQARSLSRSLAATGPVHRLVFGG